MTRDFKKFIFKTEGFETSSLAKMAAYIKSEAITEFTAEWEQGLRTPNDTMTNRIISVVYNYLGKGACVASADKNNNRVLFKLNSEGGAVECSSV